MAALPFCELQPWCSVVTCCAPLNATPPPLPVPCPHSLQRPPPSLPEPLPFRGQDGRGPTRHRLLAAAGLKALEEATAVTVPWVEPGDHSAKLVVHTSPNTGSMMVVEEDGCVLPPRA